MANVIIVDDHPVARLAIRLVLEKKHHSVVAETEDGLQALQLIRQHNPDLVIVDLDIPSLSGIEVIEKVRAAGFRGGMLVLTARDNEHYLSRCMSIGADGFVSKRNNLEQLGNAIRAMELGYSYFPLRRKDGASHMHPGKEAEALKSLSSRELQVLRHLAQGQRVIDIAQRMHISNKTVSTYKTRMMIKLELDSTLALIDFARRNHLD